MPRGQNRQTNAHERALETISNTIVADPPEEPTEVTPTATVLNLPQQQPAQETNEETKKSTKKVQSAESQSQPETRFRKPSEDFFDYINRIAPEDWSNSQTSGLYLYKRSPKGNVRITDEPLKGPITLQQFREEYLPVFGDGTYRLQFTTGLKYLTGCGENITFDGETVSLGGTSTGFLKRPSVSNVDSGFTDAIKATSEMLKDGAKAAVEVSKLQQTENNKGIDIAGIITAIAALNNHKDGDSALVKMLEAQKAEAEKRADRERADAEARVNRELAAANERQARDQQFFQMMMKQNEDRAADKDKFFEILLKEKDKKEDSFGMGDVLKELFKAFAQERLEGNAEATLPGWAGVAQSFLPKLAEAIPAFMAARNGATPQQIAQIQEQQRLAAAQAETAHGVNGGLRQQNPAEPKLITTEDSLNGFIDRLGTYLAKKLQEGKPADPAYMMTAMEEEYELVADLMYHNQKEAIIQTIANAPLGQQLLQIPTASAFLDELINRIKQPEPDDDDEQEPELVATVPAQQPSGRKKKSAAN